MNKLSKDEKKSFFEDLKKVKNIYENDNKIFDRVLLFINTFKSNNPWPYSVDELSSELEDMLNIENCASLTLYNFFIEGIDKNELDQYLGLDAMFERELTYFSKILSELLPRASYSKDNPFLLQSIHSSNVVDDTLNLTISRYDDQSLTFQVNKTKLESIIDFLSSLLDDYNENNEICSSEE